jgi:hypothetical protein
MMLVPRVLEGLRPQERADHVGTEGGRRPHHGLISFLGWRLLGLRPLEPFPLAWNQLSSLSCRIFDDEPDPPHRKML